MVGVVGIDRLPGWLRPIGGEHQGGITLKEIPSGWLQFEQPDAFTLRDMWTTLSGTPELSTLISSGSRSS